jgi:hypothetical protein
MGPVGRQHQGIDIQPMLSRQWEALASDKNPHRLPEGINVSRQAIGRVWVEYHFRSQVITWSKVNCSLSQWYDVRGIDKAEVANQPLPVSPVQVLRLNVSVAHSLSVQ